MNEETLFPTNFMRKESSQKSSRGSEIALEQYPIDGTSGEPGLIRHPQPLSKLALARLSLSRRAHSEMTHATFSHSLSDSAICGGCDLLSLM